MGATRLAGLLGEVTEGLSEDESALLAVEAVERLTVELGIPQRLRDVGVPREGWPAWPTPAWRRRPANWPTTPAPSRAPTRCGVLEEAW